MDINNIKELIKLVSESNLQDFELEKDSLKIKMSKGEEAKVVRKTYVEETPAEETVVYKETAVEKTVVEEKVEEVKVDDANIEYINSPIVGTFYGAPSPDDPQFIKVGDRVSKGQTLCIIEAMKLMNEITAEVSGEVVEILVQNEEMVQYDQPIIKIRRN